MKTLTLILAMFACAVGMAIVNSLSPDSTWEPEDDHRFIG